MEKAVMAVSAAGYDRDVRGCQEYVWQTGRDVNGAEQREEHCETRAPGRGSPAFVQEHGREASRGADNYTGRKRAVPPQWGPMWV